MLVSFWWEEIKPQYTEKNLSEKSRVEKLQTQPTSRVSPGHVVGWRMLSLFYQPTLPSIVNLRKTQNRSYSFYIEWRMQIVSPLELPWHAQSSPFLSAPQEEKFFKLIEHLRTSLRVRSAQCVIRNRNLPHFSPLDADSFALTHFFMTTRIRVRCQIFFFTRWIFNNSSPFYAVIK